MGLDPRQLKAFLAVVEAGSLGRAAEVLHLSEPAVSRTIKKLETELKVQLFERRTTGMELTSFGQALLPHANRIKLQNEETVAEIDALRGLDHGILRIGTVASAAVMVLPPVLDSLLERWPGLRVQITEAVEDKLLVELASNAIDISISGALPESDEVTQVSEHSFHDRHCVIASAEHPFVGRDDLTVEDLLGEEWIMPPPDAAPRTMFAEALHRLGLEAPIIRIETRSPAAIKAMVATTRFLGWLPEPIFASELVAGRLCRLDVPELTVPRRFYVYRRKQNFIAPPIRRFIEQLRNLSPGA